MVILPQGPREVYKLGLGYKRAVVWAYVAGKARLGSARPGPARLGSGIDLSLYQKGPKRAPNRMVYINNKNCCF